MDFGNFQKVRHHDQTLRGLLLAIVVCGLALAIPSRATAGPDEWDEVFETARAVLAKMPDPARIEATIKDPALREAVLRSYRNLKACAKVNKDQGPAVKRSTLAEFDRSFKAVQTAAEQSKYQSCAQKCGIHGAACEKECESTRKKLCGCKLNEFGCFVTKCLFG